MLLDEIKNIKGDKKELKKFGLTFAVVFIILGSLFWWRGKNYYFYCFIFSSVFLITSLLLPLLLKPIYKLWMTLALVLGYVMTRVILSVLFYFILTPVGLIARLLGNQFLDLKIDKSKESYWNYRKTKPFNKHDYEKQF